ncbi:MAG TPA: transposase family protein [Streptosporangiaceae bacterium]|nr:transposase family protein [Streptosporangiaceae bacterium]
MPVPARGLPRSQPRPFHPARFVQSSRDPLPPMCRIAARLCERRPASRKDWVTTLSPEETGRACIVPPDSPEPRSPSCAQRIEARELSPRVRRWPPILGLRNALTVTLTYLRRNRVQAEIAENYGVSQPTISRAISAITPLLVQALLDYVPTAGELDVGTCYIVDGTLLPCWSWTAHPELYSGKRKTTGMNVQVACTITGCLAWISDPIPRSRHDNHCLGESGVLLLADPRNWLGDKGYIGNNMLMPFRKPEGGELLDWQKEFNKQINKIRYVIEQVIANFKTWRIMHTDYRRPLATFPETISAVVALHFYATV